MIKDKVVPCWFPKYVCLNKSENFTDIWVLRDIIDDHTAYYWKVSGEWGRQIKYNGLIYSIECPGGATQTWIIKEYLLPSTPEEFLKHNEELATEWSYKICKEAWQEVKETNNLAKEQIWDLSHTHWYHTETYYNYKQNLSLSIIMNFEI